MAGESVLAKMAVYISANTAQFNQQLALTNNKLTAFEKGIKASALGIAGAFGFTGAVMIFKNIIGSLAGFEHAMSEVKAITQASAEEFNQLRDNALELGAATKFTAEEVAGLQAAYGRLGFTTKEILDATGATLSLATATGEDLAKSADIAGSTLRAFGLDASEMQRIVDVMASSFNKSALGLDNFGEAMKYVAPVAANAGLSIEQTTAALGVLADAGIRGSSAGTTFRKIVSDLGEGAAPILTKRLKEMAAAGLTGADAMSEVGRTAYAGLLVLANNTEKLENFTGAFNKANGEAKIMADIMTDDLIGDWERFTGAIDGAIQKGSGVIPVLRSIVQIMTGAVDVLSGGGAPVSDHWFLDALGISPDSLEKDKKVLEEALKGIRFGGSDAAYASPLIKQFGEELTKIGKITKDQLLPPLETENYWKEKLKVLNEAALGQVGSLRAATNQEIEGINKKIKALQELGNVQDRSGEVSAHLAGLPTKTADFSGFSFTLNPETVKAYESMANMQEHMKSMTDEATESILKQQQAWVETGSKVAATSILIGEGFGSVISGAQTAAQAFAQYASQVVKQIGRLIMAKMIEKAIDDKATNFNFFAKLALIGVAVGTASALINKIGSTGGGGSMSSSASTGSYNPRQADQLQITLAPVRFASGSLITEVEKQTYVRSKTG